MSEHTHTHGKKKVRGLVCESLGVYQNLKWLQQCERERDEWGVRKREAAPDILVIASSHFRRVESNEKREQTVADYLFIFIRTFQSVRVL